MVGERHPQTAPHALNQAAEYLAARFAEYGWSTNGQPFRALGKSYLNIVGIKSPPGRPAKDAQPPLLIGAHYDTVVASPGADDNASAFAVLLEAADRLRHLVVARPVWLVAFCLEEQGLLGSQAFISGLKQTGQRWTARSCSNALDMPAGMPAPSARHPVSPLLFRRSGIFSA